MKTKQTHPDNVCTVFIPLKAPINAILNASQFLHYFGPCFTDVCGLDDAMLFTTVRLMNKI